MKELISKEALILSVVPVLSFVCALVFEAGYADAFGFSLSFVDVDLKVIVISLSIVCLVLYPLYMYVEALYGLGSSEKVTSRYLAIQLVLPFPLLVSCVIAGFSSEVVNILLVLSALLALGVAAGYLIKVPKHGWSGAWELAAKQSGIKEITGPRPPSGEPNLADKIFSKLFLVIILMIFLSVIRGVGVSVAYWKIGYDVLDLDGDDVAILSGYGDHLVLGGYKDGQFNGLIYILPKNSEKLSKVRSVRFDSFLPKKDLAKKSSKLPDSSVVPPSKDHLLLPALPSAEG